VLKVGACFPQSFVLPPLFFYFLNWDSSLVERPPPPCSSISPLSCRDLKSGFPPQVPHSIFFSPIPPPRWGKPFTPPPPSRACMRNFPAFVDSRFVFFPPGQALVFFPRSPSFFFFLKKNLFFGPFYWTPPLWVILPLNSF